MRILIPTLTTLIFSTITLADSGYYEAVLGGSAADLFTVDVQNGSATAGKLSGVLTITKSSGGPFKLGHHSLFDCALMVEKIKDGTNLKGRCTTTDSSSGDQLYSHNDRKVGDTSSGSGGAGTSTFVGGTGKYKDIKGSCEYTVSYLPNKRVAAVNKCNWTR